MGIIRLSLVTLAGLGVVLALYGEDEGLPENVIGRENPIEPVFITDTVARMNAPDDSVLAKALRSDASPETATTVALVEPVKPAPTPKPSVLTNASTQSDTVSEAPKPEPEQATPLLFVTGSQVNVRGGPSTSYGVIASLPYGVAVEDLGDSGDGWRTIRLIDSGERGYMAGRFLASELN